MKKIFLLVLIFYPFVLFSQPASGDGTSGSPYSGLVTTPWHFNGDHYYGELTVSSGTLTIDAGTILRFGTGNSLSISGTGVLSAMGNSSSHITFTAAGTSWGHISFTSMDVSASQSVFDNCIIEYGDVSSGSSTTTYGGSIYTTFSNIAITNSIIRYNKATHGGGILVMSNGSPTISNCSFEQNTATVGGGGIYLYSGSASISNSLITSNSSGGGGGGGLFLDVCGNVSVINSTIANNTTSDASRAYNIQYYAISNLSVRPSFKNCIVWGNDNSISYYGTNTYPISTDFVNCGIQDVSSPASSFSSCINLSGTNGDATGPNFTATNGTDWSIKFISPCRDAGTSSGAPATDYLGNSRIYNYDIGAYEVQYSRWLTNPVDITSWTAAGNWEQGVTPVSGTGDVIIPKLTGSTVAPNISGTTTIASGKYLILEAGAKATLSTISNSGTLKLMSGVDIFSLIVDTYTRTGGTEKIELYLSGKEQSGINQWHYISPPVSLLAVSTFSSKTKNLVQFVENLHTSTANSGWIAYNGFNYVTGEINQPGFTTLYAGQGYDYYAELNYLYTFSGDLNTASLDVPLAFSGNPTLSGFNLLGNPFTSGLNWDVISNSINYPLNTSKAVFFTKDNVQYTYSNEVGVPIDATANIPPMQGFFVKTYESGHTLPIPTSAREHNNTARYKGNKTTIPLIRLSISENGKSDETVIRFNDLAKTTLDLDFDAVKMFLSSGNTSIYTSDGSTDYTINGLPFPETTVEIPVVVNFTSSGDHNISTTQLQGLDNYNVTLTDKTTGFSADLKTTPNLAFSASAGLITDRFILKVSNATTGIENPGIAKNIFNIYSSNDLINIQTIADEWEGKTGSVRVLDLAGKTISELQNAEFWKNSLTQVKAPAPKGLYVVEIRSGMKRYVGKVVIR